MSCHSSVAELLLNKVSIGLHAITVVAATKQLIIARYDDDLIFKSYASSDMYLLAPFKHSKTATNVNSSNTFSIKFIINNDINEEGMQR